MVLAIEHPIRSVLPNGLSLFVLGLLTVVYVGALSSVLFLLFERPFMYPSWPRWVARRLSAIWRGSPRPELPSS
jgi:peptidoglycan/LPS O-acetylase OafA/YrhL